MPMLSTLCITGKLDPDAKNSSKAKLDDPLFYRNNQQEQTYTWVP